MACARGITGDLIMEGSGEDGMGVVGDVDSGVEEDDEHAKEEDGDRDAGVSEVLTGAAVWGRWMRGGSTSGLGGTA